MPNIWNSVAPTLNAQATVFCVAEFNGKIYGGTSVGGRLFEWNGVNAWVEVAASIGGATDIFCLTVYEGNLYGGDQSGQLLRWDGVGAWVLINDIGTPQISSFAQLNGNLYFSIRENSGAGGQLLEWTGLGGPAPASVAPQLNAQRDVNALAVFEGKIYGGTGLGGRLFEWNGVNAWTQVAPENEGEGGIHSLVVYDGKLFGGTAGDTEGMLFEWNGTNAWITRARILNAQVHIYSLVVHHDNKLLGGTGGSANLFMWDGVSAWLQVAPQWGNQISVRGLIEFEDDVYGSTHRDAFVGGRLLRWGSWYPGPPTGLLVNDLASSVGLDGECVPAIIDSLAPYFSAIFNHSHEHAVGKHYRIQVNTASDLTGTVMWDSGKTSMTDVAPGERCENLWYAGAVLSIGVTYYWRIMFWDDRGYLGDWSSVNCFRIEQDPDVKPSKYRLTVGDPHAPSHILACEADKQDVFEMHFTLRQNGGCAEFNLKLRDATFTINLGDQIGIYLFGSTKPWYVGRVLERDRPGSSSRVREYSGYGYFETLNGHLLVDKDYGTATPNPSTIRTIAIDIMTNFVGTRFLSSDYSQIVEVAAYNITELHFDKVKPIEALTELCELAQNYEFGVNERRRIYFRPISTAITEKKWVGKHLASYSPKEDMRKIVNYWYLEGGLLVGGTNYSSVAQDGASILQHGQRVGKATVPDGFNAAEIARWGADLLIRTKDPTVKATITGINIEETETRIWPRGQMRITSEDGAEVLDFPMKTVTYHITPAGITADVELGEKKLSPRDPIRDVQKQLNEEREQLAHDVEQLAAGTGFQPMPLVYLALFKDEI